jgi:hypothetical protein
MPASLSQLVDFMWVCELSQESGHTRRRHAARTVAGRDQQLCRTCVDRNNSLRRKGAPYAAPAWVGKDAEEKRRARNAGPDGEAGKTRDGVQARRAGAGVGPFTEAAFAAGVTVLRAIGTEPPAAELGRLSRANLPAPVTASVTTKMASICLWMFMTISWRWLVSKGWERSLFAHDFNRAGGVPADSEEGASGGKKRE